MAGRPNAFVDRLARQLREIRRKKGITNETLAERLNTAEQNVRRMMRSQNMTLRTLSRLCAALGLRVDVRFANDPRGPRTPAPGRRRTRRRSKRIAS